MATISTNKKTGHRRIMFNAPDGKRKTIYLGKMPKKAAEATLTRVEALSTASLAKTSVDAETAAWLGSLDVKMHQKLAAVGLVAERAEPLQFTLAAFLDNYIASQTSLKPLTVAHLKRVRDKLVAFLGGDKQLGAITQSDADDFRIHLEQTMSDNTVRRICGRAKQFFRSAARKRLIAESPFADMRDTCVRPNRSRDFYVTREMADRVLDACPDSQWQLLFALSRFGGFRCPSEHLGLRWGDINWEQSRLKVTSPKTERHADKESRVIPIFPELLPYLEKVWDEAPDGIEYVISRYRSKNANLRTQFERIIRKAGLRPWPKLFQNLRATRETELRGQFPGHVVCAWMGHSESVAQKHYLQVTESDFERAVKGDAKNDAASSRTERIDSQGLAQEAGNSQEISNFPECSDVESYPARTRT